MLGVDLLSQDSSVGQLICLLRTQVLGVDLPSQDSSVGQLICLPRTQVLGS